MIYHKPPVKRFTSHVGFDLLQCMLRPNAAIYAKAVVRSCGTSVQSFGTLAKDDGRRSPAQPALHQLQRMLAQRSYE